ncbi:MAG: hypothetical protein QFF03_06525 [Pseudomonadota bacterium]|nr:hypothetical protein [Pseudomonadota bacterium]
MSSAYQHLALVDVRPGMVLSDVLLDQQGQVLLPQGAVLTAAIIALLPRHGVERLAVLRADAGAVPAPDQAAQRARLAQLFRRHAEDDAALATGVLRQYVARYRLDPESGA